MAEKSWQRPTAANVADGAFATASSERAAAPVAPESVNGQPNERRDHLGRYKLKMPGSGAVKSYTRATTFAGTIEERSGLEGWMKRMTAVGLARRPDLMALVRNMDVKQDREALNKIVAQAHEAAGGSVAANLGTNRHKETELLDAGLFDLAGADAPTRADLMAYADALARNGFTTKREWIERTTMVTEFGGIVGKFDRILEHVRAGNVIGDVKTGEEMEYMDKIRTQLAIYAHGVNQNGFYDWNTDTWVPGPRVREDFGIVMHLPIGKGTCTLYRVDLVKGWENAQACGETRRLRTAGRKPDPVWEGFDGYAELAAWDLLFANAESRDTLSALYRSARAAGVKGLELDNLVKIGQRQLLRIESK